MCERGFVFNYDGFKHKSDWIESGKAYWSKSLRIENEILDCDFA